MCVIIDANMAGDFVNNKEVTKPLKDWLKRKKVKLVSPPKKTILQKEYTKVEAFYRLLVEYQREGITKEVSEEDFRIAEEKLCEKDFESNDSHIIFLAEASGAKLLASSDKKLGADFKNIIKGNIYKKSSQKHLLNQNRCPK